jgi:hypothetical protein
MDSFDFFVNTISGNAGDGINITNQAPYDEANINDFLFGGNTITGNLDDGVDIRSGAYAYFYNVNFGDRTYGSGYNSIYGNSDNAVEYDVWDNETLFAEDNWWGEAPPDLSDFGGSNWDLIDYTPWLISAP